MNTDTDTTENGRMTRLRQRITDITAPAIGDEKTEQHQYVTIQRGDAEFHVTASDTPSPHAAEAPAFDKSVDIVTINGESVHFDSQLELVHGVEFDYYWGVDQASIDILL